MKYSYGRILAGAIALIAIIAGILVLWYPPIFEKSISSLTKNTVLYQQPLLHTPRVQLGDAPLVGYGDFSKDQFEILWQTKSRGSTRHMNKLHINKVNGVPNREFFRVSYRVGNDSEWKSAPEVTHTVLGKYRADIRINHSVVISGLPYNTDIRYVVEHVRDDEIVASYPGTYHTRLAAGDTAPFRFIAYGDSASIDAPAGFLLVQKKINALTKPAAFSLLLGDNTYHTGTAEELDFRFDPKLNPPAAHWISGHIDFFGWGNHDIAAAHGAASRELYSVPIPIKGKTSSVGLSEPEDPEYNYSFDYGDVHFVTFDSNSNNSPERLARQLTWVTEDLKASQARWKIVFIHHPILTVSPKSRSANAKYAKNVIEALREGGADLLLAGHAHTYETTLPLVSANEGLGENIQVKVASSSRDGLIQVISGLGGKSEHSGVVAQGQYPWLVMARSADTVPEAEFGFLTIDVSQKKLSIQQISAVTDTVIDSFSIEKE